MKVFLAEFGWAPSGTEGVVVLADSIDKAKEIIEASEGTTYFPVVCVDDEPDNHHQYRINKVEMVEGVVYSGSYCC